LVDKNLAPFDRDGIAVSSVTDLDVNDNTISNVSQYGIHTDQISGIHNILRNTITNTGNFAIFVENSSPETRQDNVISGQCVVELGC